MCASALAMVASVLPSLCGPALSGLASSGRCRVTERFASQDGNGREGKHVDADAVSGAVLGAAFWHSRRGDALDDSLRAGMRCQEAGAAVDNGWSDEGSHSQGFKRVLHGPQGNLTSEDEDSGLPAPLPSLHDAAAPEQGAGDARRCSATRVRPSLQARDDLGAAVGQGDDVTMRTSEPACMLPMLEACRRPGALAAGADSWLQQPAARDDKSPGHGLHLVCPLGAVSTRSLAESHALPNRHSLDLGLQDLDKDGVADGHDLRALSTVISDTIVVNTAAPTNPPSARPSLRPSLSPRTEMVTGKDGFADCRAEASDPGDPQDQLWSLSQHPDADEHEPAPSRRAASPALGSTRPQALCGPQLPAAGNTTLMTPTHRAASGSPAPPRTRLQPITWDHFDEIPLG